MVLEDVGYHGSTVGEGTMKRDGRREGETYVPVFVFKLLEVMGMD